MAAKRCGFVVPGWWAVALLGAMTTVLCPGRADGQATTERVSVSSTGQGAASWSYRPAISADGRFVVYESLAGNLVSGDGNGVNDIFLRDRQTGTTERVSISSAGAEADSWSTRGSVSADGRFVVFTSLACNLVNGDTNSSFDVFVRDRDLGTTERVSISSTGEQGNGSSGSTAISPDGRFVAFSSGANNLIPGDTNNRADVFVRDRQTGTTERVSLSSTGEQADEACGSPGLSADGRFVVFESYASNLVPGDTNGAIDVFVRDRQTGVIERVSLSSTGEQGNNSSTEPAISGDGRFVAFESWASNLIPDDTNAERDVFVVDRLSASLERVSVSTSGLQGGNDSLTAALSTGGIRVVFTSYARNLVPGDVNLQPDIFLRDRRALRTDLVSRSADGSQGDWNSNIGAISADGRWVAFESRSTNLVPGDTNNCTDIFVRGPLLDTIFDDGFESGTWIAWSLVSP